MASTMRMPAARGGTGARSDGTRSYVRSVVATCLPAPTIGGSECLPQGSGVRVLHVITKIGLGGAERVAETLALTTRADGIESAVLAVARGSDDAFATGLRTRLGGAGIEIIEGSRSSSNRIAAGTAAGVMGRTIVRLRPDLLHLHTEVPEFVYALARPISSAVRSTPTVHTIHHAAYWTHWRSAGWLARRALLDAQQRGGQRGGQGGVPALVRDRGA